MQMGCTSCHEIRVNKDVTRLKLITTTPQALCITCHADKDAKTIQGHVHQPAIRDCLKCHDPHTSANKYQLLKPAEGEDKDKTTSRKRRQPYVLTATMHPAQI
jgi:predicted CXXCH cytochrome family protein